MPSLRLARPAFGLGALVACAAALAAVAGHAEPPAATLRLDGVRFHPELALTPTRRATGLMKRVRAPKDGMLFVFRHDTRGGFWMKNTLVPLTVVFFDARGVRLRKLAMTPCRRDPCRIYDPGVKYRFALELPAADRRPASRIGPLRTLRRLTRLAI